MKCPFCSNPDSKVIDSRPADDGARIRRRRVCPTCGRRFTTYEAIETAPVLVVKRDGSRQPFDRNKLILGMLRACAKRHVDSAVIERAVDEIEMSLVNSFIKEVPSNVIGGLVLDKLKDIDEVAYIRFASVYRDFNDVQSFIDELNRLRSEKK